LNGKKIEYKVGFHCHGPLVENAAMRDILERTKELKLHSDSEIREICKDYTFEKLKEYVITMSRWGIMTDFR